MDVTWLCGWEIRDLIEKREVSPVEVTKHFLERAEELDPVLHCYRVLDVNGAREQAKHSEEAVLRGDELGPLHGVPMGIKEHLQVAGLPYRPIDLSGDSQTDDGAGPIAERDAVVVRRLREAGAIITGTTVSPGRGTHELRDAQGRPTTDLTVHPRNPWDLTRVPGASSAGTCAAVSGGLLPMAIGSDGGGSTRIPAAFSGVLGLHASMGRVPSGSQPSVAWCASIGPVTRSARDGALALQAIAGPDGAEIISLQSDPPDYLTGLDDGVEGLRFAWTDDYGFAGRYATTESARVLDVVRDSARRFTELGATVDTLSEPFVDWRGMHELGPVGSPTTPEGFRRGQDVRSEWWDGYRKIFANHDVLLTPTVQLVALEVEAWEKSWTEAIHEFISVYCALTFPQNFLGWPALSIPCGFVDGLPVGLELTGPPDSEGLLYRAANAFLRAYPQGHPAVAGGS